MNRTVALALSVFLLLPACGAFAKNGGQYLGIVTDERVARCGITVSGDGIMRIEPFLEGRGDLEGSLVLDMTKESGSGRSQSTQTSAVANGILGRVIFSAEGSADVTIEMIVRDRSGKTLCELRRSMTFENATTKI